MYAIDLIDRSFQKEAAGTCDLSLQAHPNGLAYCIFDRSQEQYVAFRHHNFENVHLTGDLTGQISTVLEKDELLELPFHFVRFLGYTQQTTLVPATFFDAHRLMDYLSFNHAGEVDHELFSNPVRSLDLFNVFALQRDLVSTLTLHFKKVEFLNQTTPFLKHVALDHEKSKGVLVHAGLNHGFFDAACVDNGKLLLYNTFLYSNESDLLYYMLYIYKQLGLNVQDIPLYLSGELSSKLSFFDILRQYVPGTQHAPVQGIPALTTALYQVNKAKFLNLLNIIPCALSAEHTAAEK